ncbi:outer membrane beta-barrel protein [Vibrio sp. R78045]|uniref:outer membrane beta-barrel protein n=1 Tax=Vibrio sp. R78045 TaxID=3093868 RepID=UPI0036F1E9F4
MNLKSKSVLMCALVLSASTANASFKPSTMYVGLDMGSSRLIECSDVCDDTGLAMGALVGYQLNNWLSIEGGYMLETNYKYNNEDLMAHSGLVGFKLQHHFNSDVAFFVTPGISITEFQFEDDAYNDSAFSVYAESGFQKSISNKWDLEVKYRHRFNADVPNLGGSEASQIMVGLRYNFSNDVDDEKAKLTKVVPVSKTVDHTTETYHKNEEDTVVTVSKFVLSESSAYKLLFENDSYKVLNAEGISKLVKSLDLDSIQKIKLIGYTDSNGSESYNINLSYKRAEQVRSLLVQLGIPFDLFEIEGLGEFGAIADNSTSKGRALNRRVEFNLYSLD